MSTTALGIRATPEFPIPHYPTWTTTLRTIASAENAAAVAAVAANQRINLLPITGYPGSGSRFGLNTITLLVHLLAGTTSATIDLWAAHLVAGGGTAYHKVRSDAITGDVLLTYQNLPPLVYVPSMSVVSGGAGVEITGGGTF